MLDTWGQILTLAIGFTVFALWRMNLLLSLGASAIWIAFLAYHLDNQPVGVADGSTADTYIIWGMIILIIAIPLITISRTRQRESFGSLGSVEGDTLRQNGNNKQITLSNMNTAQYQAYIRNKLHRG